MPSRTPNSWYRKAVVAASIVLLAAVAGGAFLLINQNQGSAEVRLLEAGATPAGVTGALTAEGSARRLPPLQQDAEPRRRRHRLQGRPAWTTEGWWNVAAGTCETLMAGPLVSRFYYIYAVDYDQGGVVGRQGDACARATRCSRSSGIEDCVARGYERTGFFEVDTGEQRSWTVQLTEPGEQRHGRPMRRSRKVKILATLGPASSDKATIDEPLRGRRRRLPHQHEPHRPRPSCARSSRLIREVESEVGRPIGILADLQGPKLRIGTFAERAGRAQRRADASSSTPTRRRATRKRVELPHPEILAALEPGHRLLLDDGKVRLRVTEAHASARDARRRDRHPLSDRKGVSVPDTTIAFGALTDEGPLRPRGRAQCRRRLDRAVLRPARRRTSPRCKKIARGRAGVLAKIEKPQAVERLAAIIEFADALMVARGDLGVEMPLERVPGIQKHITRAARRAGKPVVVATQMLESMITAPVPTRAEVSDVATAVFEGADAIMLSAESAAGAFPVEAVATMDRIAREVERDPNYGNIMHAQRTEPEATGADAISAAARQIAETLNLAAICCYTVLRRHRHPRRARAAGDADHRPLADRCAPPAACRSSGGFTASPARSRHDLDGMVDHACRGGAAARASPSPASASSSPPACRSARPARPTCSASPSSAATAGKVRGRLLVRSSPAVSASSWSSSSRTFSRCGSTSSAWR